MSEWKLRGREREIPQMHVLGWLAPLDHLSASLSC